MSQRHRQNEEPGEQPAITKDRAQELLAMVPERPRRAFGWQDHLCTAVVSLAGLSSGMIALSGHPLWAMLPGLLALVVAGGWLATRSARANEPRFRGVVLPVALFTTWLTLPIWRGITRGDTAPFPEALIFASLGPAAWLVFYIVLLIRR